LAIQYNLHIEAGATFTRDIVYTNEDGSDFNLTGYTGKLQVRPTVTSSTLSLEVIPTINVTTSTISWTFTPAQTSALVNGYAYALEITNGTIVIRLIEGTLVVSPELVR
jgi:outer membrane protein assembly factor BamB